MEFLFTKEFLRGIKDMNFQSKKILLTGATGGLGKEMVKSFTELGAQLILSDIKEDSLQSMQNSYKNSVIGVIRADLSSEEGCNELIENLEKLYPTPDILINNAGIAVFGRYCDTPLDKIEKVISINLLSPMRITHPILKKMVSRKSGYIVNICSVAGLIAAAGLSSYCTSKFAIKAFGEAIYHDYREFGIKVSNLYPFFTDTPILQSEQFGFKNKKMIPDYLLSKPSDVINDLIKGMEKETLHIYPGVVPYTIDMLTRFMPGFVEILSERQLS